MDTPDKDVGSSTTSSVQSRFLGVSGPSKSWANLGIAGVMCFTMLTMLSMLGWIIHAQNRNIERLEARMADREAVAEVAAGIKEQTKAIEMAKTERSKQLTDMLVLVVKLESWLTVIMGKMQQSMRDKNFVGPPAAPPS